jgi:hypothetical protein
MDKGGAGPGFLRELRFVSPANLHSICFSTIIFTITQGWYNRPEVAAVPIASQTNQRKIYIYIPRKSLKRLAQETGVTTSGARTASTLLKLRSYKTTVIHALQPYDSASRFNFAIYFYSLSSKVSSTRS